MHARLSLSFLGVLAVALVACDASVTAASRNDASATSADANAAAAASGCLCEGILCVDGATITVRFPRPLTELAGADIEVCKVGGECLVAPLDPAKPSATATAMPRLEIVPLGTHDVEARWSEERTTSQTFAARVTVAAYYGEASGRYVTATAGKCYPPRENPNLECPIASSICGRASFEVVVAPADAGPLTDAAADAATDALDAD